MKNVKPLEPTELYQYSDPEKFGFNTTDDLKDLAEVIGQPRAIEAVKFGIGIGQPGYNIFAMGSAGTGKRALIKRHFEQRAAGEPVPPDWVYVNNFEEPHKPKAISLPAGKGSAFRQDMESFVEELRTNLTSAFESDEYRSRRQSIEQEAQEQQEKSLEELQEKAREKGFSLIRTPGGLVFAPIKDGEVLSPEEFQQLEEEERKKLESELEELQEELKQIMQKVPRVQRSLRERITELNQEITNYSVGGLIDDLQEKYSEFSKVIEFLDEVQKDVVENAAELLASEAGEDGGQQGNLMAALMGRSRQAGESRLRNYQANLLVDNRDLEGAPVIHEENPTYQNLVGRVEHRAQMGALFTDFRLIKPGALHRANGGYLILDIRQVLLQPYSWEALKRVLQSGEVKIESIGQMLSLISTVSLEPEPIPLDVKVAVHGDRMLYYMLSQLDPDFNELFKVQADFEEQMDRNDGNQELYARMIATKIHENELKTFDRDAVARVIEYSARLVGDSEKLSTEVRAVDNLLREANYWAEQNGDNVVRRDDVQKAIDAQIYRADRLRERVQETILRGTYLIDTQGEQVGQVNGLSVIQLGSFSFGRPSRITARVRMGKGEVVDIEREVELSGPIHSKGVLILSGFLGARYAREHPLSLSASLVFEQSYGGVDGDSASSAELYALLSAISEVPIKQNFAVTGSINQLGEVQAIGGANEKIEGFFDICKARGLTGDQGVLIPESNVIHLMLREDVIQAVKDGKFNIYPIENVDQGIELLTGMPAGEPDQEGKYPADTINGHVQARLEKLAEKRRQLTSESKEESS
jgi:lon-related putative ATP-dependent protease